MAWTARRVRTRRNFDALTPIQHERRVQAAAVVSAMRDDRTLSLRRAAAEEGVRPEMVLRYASEALAMGLAWRVVPDADLAAEAQRAADTIAALDPGAVRATKRLMTAGRGEVARAAREREFAEMRRLFDAANG